MGRLFRKKTTSFIEPTNIFEELEQRIVLDASIAAVADQTVTEDSTMTVDVQAADEGNAPDLSYDLQVDDGSGPVAVDTYNANNDPNAADIQFNTSTGEIEWTPNNLDVGDYVFTVSADDGGYGNAPHTDSQSFNVSVDNRPSFITTSDGTSFSEEGGVQTFDVESEDEPLGVNYGLQGQPGWLLIDPSTGVISGDPTLADVGDHVFTVVVNDGHVDEPQVFTLTVTNSLEFTSADNTDVTEDDALLFDVQTDSETLGDRMTYSLDGREPPGLSIDPDTGVITWNPDNSDVHPPGNPYQFTITAVDDDTGETLDQDFTLTVHNDPPAFLNVETDIYMTETSGAQNFDVQTDDEGVPPGGTAYALLSYDGNAVPGWLSIDADTGMITGDPGNADVGDHTIVVQFDDGNTPDGVQTLQFDLHVANKPNYFTSADATTWTEDLAGQAFDADTNDEGDGVTYSLSGAPSWISINPTTGLITALGDAPDNSHVGDHTFTIHAQDAIEDVTQTFTLTVLNTPPLITSGTLYADEDAGVQTVQVQLADPEPDAPAPKDPVTFSFASPAPVLPSGATVTMDSDGLITVNGANNEDVGSYLFNVKVTDGNGGEHIKALWLEVRNVDPLWVDPQPPADLGAINEDTPWSYDLTTDDQDQNPYGGTTRYELVSAPGWVSLNTATGELSGTPVDADVGNDQTITVRFYDANGGQVEHTFTIDVVNVPPVITSPDNDTWYEDGYPNGQGWQSFDFNSTDEGQPGAFFEFVGAPAWLTIDPASGRISGVPINENVSDWTFQVIAHDGNGGVSAPQDFTLHVDNNAPVFDTANEAYFDIDGGTQTFDAHTDDENSDRDPTQGAPDGNQYELDGAPAGVTIDPKTGVITVADPNVSGLGDHSFTIRFFDGTVWIEQPFTLHITDTPPNATDPINYDPGFFSPNNTRMLEDESNQVFDVQWQNEGQAGVSYALDPGDSRFQPGGELEWLSIDPATGVLTGSPTNDDVTWPIPDSAWVFDIIVTDPSLAGGSVTETLTLHVDNVDPFWQTPPVTATFTEDVDQTNPATAQVYDVLNTDEGDGTETSYSLVSLAGDDPVPSWLRIEQDTGRIYAARTLTNDDVMGSWSIHVQFDDGHGGVVDQALTVVLEDVLHFNTGNSASWQEDNPTPFSFDVNTDDEGAGTVYDVQYSLSGAPSWLSIDPTTGVITSTSGFSPDNTDPGTYTFSINAYDGSGSPDDPGHGVFSQTFTLTVPNRDPVFDPSVDYSDLHMGEDNGPDVIDINVDDENQGRWYYTLSSDAPQWISIHPFTGELRADPTNEHVGVYNFTITAWDGNERYAFGDPSIDGKTDEAVTLTVDNLDPVFTSPAADTANEDSAWTFNVQSTDESVGGTRYSLSDPATDPNDTGWGAETAAGQDWVFIDPETGVLTANPTNEHVGTHTITVWVDDQHGGVISQDFTLTVNNVPPVWQTPPGAYSMTLTEDTTGNFFDLMASDELQHNLYAGTEAVYFLTGAPPGVTIDQHSGYLRLDVTNSDIGTTTFQITMDDGNGGQASIDFTLTVVNTAPEFTTPNVVVWTEDDPSFSPFDVDTTDEPDDHWIKHDNEYTLIGAPSWLEIDAKSGVISIIPGDTVNANGAPDNHLVGTYDFTVDFFDGDVNIQQPFTLRVVNTATDITDVADQVIVEDTQLTGVTDSDIQARDEYDITGYDQDHYELYIRLNNQGNWIRVDDGTYNAANDSWNGADITFDTTTGEIDWTPNNADVPKLDDPATPGTYHHQFRVVHYDGHGSTADDYFYVEIVNVPPQWTPDPPGVDGTVWALTEDTHGFIPDSDVQTDEEGVGVEYQLEIRVDTDNDGTADTWVNADDYRPNGTDGGLITIDDTTGRIDWTPTNADVTILQDGTTQLRAPYEFRVRAWDGNPDASVEPPTPGAPYTDWAYFTSTVQNTATDIPNEPPAQQSWNEDDLFHWNFAAIDEETERPSSDPYFRDTHYTLEISYSDGSGGWTAWQDFADYNDNNDGDDRGNRSPVSFDVDTGVMDWRPNHLDAQTPDYQFRVTHYDGHGSSDSYTFELDLQNEPPNVVLPNPWTLTEDATPPPADINQWNFDSDDEQLGVDVVYAAQIWVDANDDGVVQPTEWVGIDAAGLRPNGLHGGLLTFDETTDVMEWPTTNEDVTYNDDGTPAAPHLFRVAASDDGGASWSNWRQFDVVVENAATTISDVPDQTIQEASELVVSDAAVDSIDEYPSEPGYPADDYYSLEIQVNGTWTVVHDGSAYGPYNTDNDAWNGGDITFDPKTGEMRWTPTNSDVTVDAVGVDTPHQFRVTHHDGHGSTAQDPFAVTVTNKPPFWTGPDPLPNWTLVEDVFDSFADTYDDADHTVDHNLIQTDEEGQGLVYEFQIDVGDGNGWQDWDSYYAGAGGSHRPNGAYGGDLTFDTTTGKLVWQARNADVTLGWDAAGNPTVQERPSYEFRVRGNDGHGGYTDWKDFAVDVQNTATDIRSPANESPIPDVNMDEDSLFDYNLRSRDEWRHETDITAYWKDAYFELEVDGVSVVDANYDPNTGWYTYTPNADGGTIYFNKDSGIIRWIPTDADSGRGYTFDVIHHDGHGSEAPDQFVITVDNTDPRVYTPFDWILNEDDAVNHPAQADLWTLDEDRIRADDEGLGTFDYSLSIDGTAWYSGYRPNGALGGEVIFDTTTGEIRWATTNADVNVDTGTALVHREVYSNDFDNLDGLVQFPMATGYSVKGWEIDNGTLTNQNNWEHQVLFGENTWKDMTMDVRARAELISGHPNSSNDSFGYGIYYNADYSMSQGERAEVSDGYLFSLDLGYDYTGDPDHPTFRVQRVENGALSGSIASVKVDDVIPGFDPYAWHDISIGTDSGHHVITVDGTTVLDFNDSTFAWGMAGFRTWGNDIHAYFDSVQVYENTYDPATTNPYQFTVTATDQHGGTTAETFLVHVTNDPTDITDVADQTITEDNLFTVDLGSRDEEVESTDTARFEDAYYEILVDRDNDGTWETLADYNTNNGVGADIGFDKDTGVITWTPNNADVGDYDFHVIHHDGHGSTAEDYFLLTVDNRPPEWTATPPGWDLVEDHSSTFSGSNIHTDDEGLGLTYDLQVSLDNGATWVDWTPGYRPNGPDGGELIFNENTGEIQWTPTNADTTLRSDGSTQHDPYLFRISGDDGQGGSTHDPTWQEFQVTVANDPTDITDVSDQSVTEDSHFTVDFGSRDEDVETTDAGRFEDSYYEILIDRDNDGTWESLTDYNANNGSGADIIFDKDTGVIDWDPNNADVGDYNVRVIHHDGHGSTAEDYFLLTVDNRPPTLSVPVAWTLTEDDGVNHPAQPNLWTLDESLVASDDEGLGLTYSLTIEGVAWTPGYRPNGPEGGEVFFDTSTGEIRWQTTNADVTQGAAAGPYDFLITANDGHGGTASGTVQVTVDNDPTDINDVPDQTITEDGGGLHLVDGDVRSRDEQVESSNPGRFSDSYYTLEVDRLGDAVGFVDVGTYNGTNGAGADIVFDPSTGALDWNDVTNRDVGTYDFRIVHHDGHGSEARDLFTVNVENAPPHFTNSLNGQTVVVPATKYFTYDFGNTDEGQHDWRGDDRVSYELVAPTLPGLTIDQDTGYVHWRAPATQTGEHWVTIRVLDGNGGWDLQTFKLIVDDPGNDLPITHRPETGATQDPFEEPVSPGGKPGPTEPGVNPHMPEHFLPGDSPLQLPQGEMIEEILKRGVAEEHDLMAGLEALHGPKQPPEDIGGSVDETTPLAGYESEVPKGKRIDFAADDAQLWGSMNGGQPSLDIGGSVSHDTPLEGYPEATDAGMRLDFDYHPIRETAAFFVEDIHVSDLLGL